MATKLRMTVEEYLAMPEEPPYREYVNGEVVDKAMPDGYHSLICEELTLHIAPYGRRRGGISGPEIRVMFPGQAYRLPDYAYWAPGKPRGSARRMLPPTLAIEIRSPGEPLGEQRDKCRFYLANGVEVAWFIDPERRVVEVFEDSRAAEPLPTGATLTSAHLPGFELNPAELWARMDELAP